MVLAPLELNPARIGTATYDANVEQWRPLVTKYFPPDQVDKVLYVINGESGGNATVPGDGGAAYGLFQSHYVSKDSTPEAQVKDALRLYNGDLASGGTGYGDWGEGRTYNGQSFGALGRAPYGSGYSQSLQGGSASSSVLPAAQAGAIARMNFPNAAPAQDTSATATAQPLQSTQPAFTPAPTQPMVGGEATAAMAPPAQAAQIANSPIANSFVSTQQSAQGLIAGEPDPGAQAHLQSVYDTAIQLGKDPLVEVQAAQKDVGGSKFLDPTGTGKTNPLVTGAGASPLIPRNPSEALATIGGLGSAAANVAEPAIGGLPKPLQEPARQGVALTANTVAGPGSVASKAAQVGASLIGGEATNKLGLGRTSGQLLGGIAPAGTEGIVSAIRGDSSAAIKNVVEEGAGSIKPPARPVDELIQHVQSAGAARPDLLAARKAELSRRLAAAAADLQASGTPPSEAFAQARRNLAGQLADPSFTPPSSLNTDALHSEIIDAVTNKKVDFFTGNTADEALKKLENGVIPAPHEVEALGKVFGPDLQTAVSDLGDVFKVKRAVEERFTGAGSVPITLGPNGELNAANITEAVSSLLPKTAAGNSKAITGAVQRLINEERLVATVDADGKTVLRLKGPQFDALGETVREAQGNGLGPYDYPPDSPVITQPMLGEKPVTEPGPNSPVLGGDNPFAGRQPVGGRPDPYGNVGAKSKVDPETLARERFARSGEPFQAGLGDLMPEAGPTPPSNPLTLDQMRLNRASKDPNVFQGEGSSLPPPRNPTSGAQGSFSDWKPGQPLWKKVANVPLEVLGFLPRQLQTSFDYSYPFRQGALLIRHQQEFWSSFGNGLRSLTDPGFAAAKQAEILKRPYNPSNLDLTDWRPGQKLTDMEEGFMGRLADSVPVIGHIIRASNRAATVFINDLRSGVTNTFARTQLRYGRSLSDLAPDLEAYANYVNRATGRGNLGQFESSLPALNQVFYGLRRNVAMVQAPGYLFHSSAAVRKEAMLDMVAFVGVGAATLKLAQLAGADVGMVPGTADFGKIRVGNTRVDIWGGYQQLAGVITKVIQGQIANPGSSEEFASAVLPFISNKLAPGPNFAINQSDKLRAAFQSGQKKQTLEQAAVNSATPLAASGLIDAIKEDGAEGGALALTGFFGTGTQSYTAKSDIGAGDVRDAVKSGAVPVKTYLDPAGNSHPIETLNDLKAASPLAYDQFLKDHPAVAGSLADADSPTQHQVRGLQDELNARQQQRDDTLLKSDPAAWRAASSDDSRLTAAHIDGIMSTQGDFKGEPTTLLAAAQKQYHDLIDSNTDKKSTNVNWDMVDRGVAQMSPDAQKLLFESSLKGETDARKQYLTDIKQLEPYFKQRDEAWAQISAKSPALSKYATFDDFRQSIVDKIYAKTGSHTISESAADDAVSDLGDFATAKATGYLVRNRNLIATLDKYGFYIPSVLRPLTVSRQPALSSAALASLESP